MAIGDEGHRKERVEFRPSQVPEVRILSVRDSWHRWSLFHEAYALTLVRGGAGSWRYRRRDRAISPAEMMLIEPGDVHVTTQISAAAAFDTLFVAPTAFEAAARRCGLPSRLAHFTDVDCTDSIVVDAFRAFHATISAQGEVLEQSQALETALFSLFRRACEGELPAVAWHRTRIRRARDLLHDLYRRHDTSGLSMADLAATVGLTPIQLIRGFKDLYGLPPYQYLMRMRVAEAQRLIEVGPTRQLRSLTDVATESGFFDLAHMDRHFRRILCITPSAYGMGLRLRDRWARARRGKNHRRG